MTNPKDFFIHTLNLLETKPGVIFTQSPDTNNISAYIEGYISCLEQFGTKNLTKDLCSFFAATYNVNSTAMAYTNYQRVFDKELNDKEKIQKFLRILRDFAAIKNWEQ